MTKKKTQKDKQREAFLVILFVGTTLWLMAWVIEINFHYIQGFSQDNVPEDIFWRAEQSIYPISVFLMIFGVFLIFYAYRFYEKK